jgi:PAS domain S-box-containing protein
MFAFESGNGTIINVNPAAEAFSGYSRKELLGLNIAMMHPESERDLVLAEFLRAEGQFSSEVNLHIKHKDGHCVPVVVSTSKSSVADGRDVVVCIYRDISLLQKYEHHLITQRWALAAYAGAALALWQKHKPESLLQAMCEAITRESNYVLAWIGIAEDGPGKPVRVAGVAGSSIGYMDGLQVGWSEDRPDGHGPVGICIRTGKVKIIEDSEASEFFEPWRMRARESGIRSCISIPIFLAGDKRGALIVYAARPEAFEPVAVEVFQHLAEQIGHGIYAIEQQQLLEAERVRAAKMEAQLTEALSAMVAPIVLAMEMRDPYTAGHENRVAEIAVAIGREMGWPEQQLQGMRIAALVHDIGKITIPAEILNRPGKLSPAEWAVIIGHPETAHAILRDIPFVWPVAEIVRQHHEKLDGSGYPFGLKESAILPEAKVLAVADIMEAMASNRPYRPAIDLAHVLEMLESQAGTLLDAEAVRICVSLFREKRLVIPGLITHLPG